MSKSLQSIYFEKFCDHRVLFVTRVEKIKGRRIPPYLVLLPSCFLSTSPLKRQKKNVSILANPGYCIKIFLIVLNCCTSVHHSLIIQLSVDLSEAWDANHYAKIYFQSWNSVWICSSFLWINSAAVRALLSVICMTIVVTS